MAHTTATVRPGRKQWLFLLLALAGLYVLLPQLSIFHSSLQALDHIQSYDVCVAVGLSALTYFAAATTYRLLANKKLRYGRTVLVQLASMFTNRLLPAGIGGIGANYIYLRKSGHTTTQAAGVVAANNLMGFIGHVVLVCVLLAAFHAHLPPLHLLRGHFMFGWFDKFLVLVFLAVLIAARHFRHRLKRGFRRLFKQLLTFQYRPFRLSGALLTSVGLTLCNILSLYYCTLALHIHVAIIAIVLVFTLGIALGTVTPTPGGLGGVEAGLVAGLVAYRVASADALAAVLVYRLVSYWLMLAIGAAAFVIAERRGYL